jgi:hypothetical protein
MESVDPSLETKEPPNFRPPLIKAPIVPSSLDTEIKVAIRGASRSVAPRVVFQFSVSRPTLG